MDHSTPRKKDIDFDLESGGNTSEEDSSNDLCVSERDSKSALTWSLNGILNSESCSNFAKSDDIVVVYDDENLELLVDKGLEHVQDQEQLSLVNNGNHGIHKTKLINPRKPPKPPLPPKGPSLDAGDQKFVKELAELALRKRARIKKMKATRKMKAIKQSSSSSSSSPSSYANLSAMVVTIFFFLVIIFHGFKSANSAALGVMASPEASVASDDSLISVQYPKNFTNESDASGSQYRRSNSFSTDKLLFTLMNSWHKSNLQQSDCFPIVILVQFYRKGDAEILKILSLFTPV
ncbi:unnamed protein product [Lupinus luteus]|uniref:Transmembrane protein n=1 Tax=Lupinus luteus TaxID=3873 RepID=A0AAV1X4Q8_LUPLU